MSRRGQKRQKGVSQVRPSGPSSLPSLKFTRNLIKNLCFQSEKLGDLVLEYHTRNEDEFKEMLGKLTKKKNQKFRDLFTLLTSSIDRKDKKKKRKIVSLIQCVEEENVKLMFKFLHNVETETSKTIVDSSFSKVHFLVTKFAFTQVCRYFIEGEIDTIYGKILRNSLECENSILTLLSMHFLAVMATVGFENGIKEIQKRENIKQRKKQMKRKKREARKAKMKKKRRKVQKEDDDDDDSESDDDENESDEDDEDSEEEIEEELERDVFVKETKVVVKKVRDIRDRLTNEDLLDAIISVLEVVRGKDSTKRAAAYYAARYLSTLLSIGYEDEDFFDDLCITLLKLKIDEVLCVVINDFEMEKELLSPVLTILYYLSKHGVKKNKVKLIPCFTGVCEILMLRKAQKKFNYKDGIVFSCCLVIGNCCSKDKTMTRKLLELQPGILGCVCRFMSNIVRKHRDIPTFDIYAAFSGLMGQADVQEVIRLNDEYNLMEILVSDFKSSKGNIDKMYPLLIAIKVFCSRIEDPRYLGVLLEYFIDQRVFLNILKMLKDQMFKDKKKQKKEKDKRKQNRVSRKEQKEGFFGYPALSSCLNILLQIAPKVSQQNQGVLKKMNNVLMKDKYYPEICKFAMRLEKQKKKKFSYKGVVILFCVIVVILVMFPIVYRIIKPQSDGFDDGMTGNEI